MRYFAIGDPQVPLDHFLTILRRCGLLNNNRLRDDVCLVSIGDHFDYNYGHFKTTREDAQREGVAVLKWLADHPRDQVRIILGNHDICRVMELVNVRDTTFSQAHTDALEIDEARKNRSPRLALLEAQFRQKYPQIPTPGLAQRDFSAFCEAQRELLQNLLMDRRVALAFAGELLTGERALFSHAGLTNREVGILETEPTPAALSQALVTCLHAAIAVVEDDWKRGNHVPLDLGPIHIPGTMSKEGGGLLYHRPTMKTGNDWADDNHRRFHPRDLPLGLVQVCGHTQHEKCTKDEAIPVEEGATIPSGGIRCLHSNGTDVTYTDEDARPPKEDGVMWMIDGGLLKNPDTVKLFEFAGWAQPM